MSNLFELIDGLRTSGVHLAADGDKLRYRAPKGVMTDEVKQALVNHKPGIIRLLQAGVHREGPPYPDGLGRVKCCYCEHCGITGTKAVCRVSKECRIGIALLLTCESFVMKTIH
jgi:hypothetical protein